MFESVGAILRFPFYALGLLANFLISGTIIVFGNVFVYGTLLLGVLWLPFAFITLSFQNDKKSWESYLDGLKPDVVDSGFARRQSRLSAWLAGEQTLGDGLGCGMWVLGILLGATIAINLLD